LCDATEAADHQRLNMFSLQMHDPILVLESYYNFWPAVQIPTKREHP
jgi:hypothetical protein